jgi:F-type H+-transporting ATPase subunit epsilon
MPIELVIVTPQGESFRGPVESVVLPGAEGEFEVLAQHERFLCPLKVGAVAIKSTSDLTHAVIASGFADVSGSQVAVLVESCEVDEDIDHAWAQLELDRAKAGLAAVDADENRERYEEYERALAYAEARVEIATRGTPASRLP